MPQPSAAGRARRPSPRAACGTKGRAGAALGRPGGGAGAGRLPRAYSGAGRGEARAGESRARPSDKDPRPPRRAARLRAAPLTRPLRPRARKRKRKRRGAAGSDGEKAAAVPATTGWYFRGSGERGRRHVGQGRRQEEASETAEETVEGPGRGGRGVQAEAEGGAEEAGRDEGEGCVQRPPGYWRNKEVRQKVVKRLVSLQKQPGSGGVMVVV